MCAFGRRAGHLRVKSASTLLMWVGAAEHVAGETNKAGSRCATMETSGDVLGSPSLWGREAESLPQSGGPTLGLEQCDVSWMVGSMFDLCLRAEAKPDTFTQSV